MTTLKTSVQQTIWRSAFSVLRNTPAESKLHRRIVTYRSQGSQTHNNLLEANNIERMCMVIYHEFDKTVKMHIKSH